MADQREAGISWTDETWNPVVGCSIVSPACTNCYAMAMAARIERMAGGTSKQTHYAGTTRTVNGKPVWTGKLQLAPDHILTAPLRWKRPRRVFVNSMSDLFHEDMPEAWIDRVFAVMALSPQHTYQILTKRPERMRRYFSGIDNGDGEWIEGDALRDALIEGAAQNLYASMHSDADAESVSLWLSVHMPLPNVWLGVTAEDQRRANERVPHLLATPAAVRFVSAEPLLGPIRFHGVSADGMRTWNFLEGMSGAMDREFGPDFDYAAKLDWVIAGGESGPGARPTHPDWIRSIRDQCAATGVAFHFKQWGEFGPSELHPADTAEHSVVTYAGRHLQGMDAVRGDPEDDQAEIVARFGKRRAGRMLDGRIHDAFPAGRAGG
jgi:protein gp37